MSYRLYVRTNPAIAESAGEGKWIKGSVDVLAAGTAMAAPAGGSDGTAGHLGSGRIV
jgi:hypothetical protein